MSSDDFQVQNIYQYSRKTYKRNCAASENGTNSVIQVSSNNEPFDTSPRTNGNITDHPICSCDLDHESEVADMLHKKCPVILLAQKQLQRLLEETDKLLSETNNETYCRSLRNVIKLSKELFQNKCACALLVMIMISFIFGLLLGAASCGTNLRRFNSPILTAIEDYFVPDTYPTLEETFRCIA